MPTRYIPPALRGTTPSAESTPTESTANNPIVSENEINSQGRRLTDLELNSPSHKSYDNKHRGRGNNRSRGRGRGRAPGFYQNSNEKRDYQDYDDGRKTGMRTIDEIHEHYWPSKMWEKRSTLNDAEDRRGELAYIVLFRGANPRWAGEKIIFAKTNIDYLPRVASAETGVDEDRPAPTEDNTGDKESAGNDTSSRDELSVHRSVPDGEGSSSIDVVTPTLQSDSATPAPQTPGRHISQDIRLEEKEQEAPPILSAKPIAVFEQIRYSQSGRSYRFKDWFLLARLDFLQPHSPGLVRMLQQKWGGTDHSGQAKDQERREAAWLASLSVEWAVMKMVQENEGREQPDIAVHESKDFTDGGAAADQERVLETSLKIDEEFDQGAKVGNEGAKVESPFTDADAQRSGEGTKENLGNMGRNSDLVVEPAAKGEKDVPEESQNSPQRNATGPK